MTEEQASFIAKIKRLKAERGAVILAHNYQIAEIQELADYVGDSLGLAYRAREAKEEVIVFCGVHFMAETAKIVNPGKTVLVPDRDAGCSLEQACPAEELEDFLEKNRERNYYVVAYINCSAAVKALADVICTSGNAKKIVQAVPEDREILFLPDRHLGSWVMEQTGREMRLWDGACYVHVEFRAEVIDQMRAAHPGAKVVAHPECMRDVREAADVVCSTEKMIDFARESEAEAFVIVTESGMLHRLRREVPGKQFIAYATEGDVFAPCPTEDSLCANCKYMKMNTLENLYACLKKGAPEVLLDEALRKKAEVPLLRMLEISAR